MKLLFMILSIILGIAGCRDTSVATEMETPSKPRYDSIIGVWGILRPPNGLPGAEWIGDTTLANPLIGPDTTTFNAPFGNSIDLQARTLNADKKAESFVLTLTDTDLIHSIEWQKIDEKAITVKHTKICRDTVHCNTGYAFNMETSLRGHDNRKAEIKIGIEFDCTVDVNDFDFLRIDFFKKDGTFFHRYNFKSDGFMRTLRKLSCY